MRFNTAPVNTLFAKVSIKVQPYSQQPVAVRVLAHTHEQFTANNALCYSELTLENITMQVLQAKLDEFQQRTNTASVQVKIQPKVIKLMSVA